MLWHFRLSVCVSKRLNVSSKFFYHLTDPSIILVYHHQGSLLNFNGFTSKGVPNKRGEVKKGQFLTNKFLYPWNSARYGHSCYRSGTGSHTRATKWWHFNDLEWPQPPVSRSPIVWRQISREQCMLWLATWRCVGFSATAEVSCIVMSSAVC